MAVEDLTTWAEVDTGGYLTITSSRAQAVNMHRDCTSYITKDCGANFWSGNFTFLYEIYLTGVLASVINGPFATNWSGHYSDSPPTSYGSLYVQQQCNNTDGSITLVEFGDGGSFNYYDSDTISKTTLYYCKMVRDESVGTYGTLYNYVYSDAARTSLVCSETLTLHDKRDFRYIQISSLHDSTTAYTYNGYIQNVDLGLSTASKAMLDGFESSLLEGVLCR